MKVSVALCTWNGAAYLEEQLRSILEQTRLPDEIIISDDASADDTVAIVERVLSGSSLDWRLLRNATALGVSRNFEQALLATTGELVLLSDQDDRWYPDRVEATLARFEVDQELTLLFSDARMVDGAGAELGYTLVDSLEISAADRAAIHSGGAFGVLLRRNLATGATVAFRRALLSIATPFPAEWVHDEWLTILAAATGTVDLLERPLIDYRQHGSNQIGATERSVGHKIRRVFEPRGDRNTGLAIRTGILVDKVIALGELVERADLTAARGKLRIERARAAMPGNRIARIVPVLREARSGDYARYTSQGRTEILRDLLQPR